MKKTVSLRGPQNMAAVREDQPLLPDDNPDDVLTDVVHRLSPRTNDNNDDNDSFGSWSDEFGAPDVAAGVSSLDFERIVNQYSIQAVRDRWLLPPLPADGSSSRRQQRKENSLRRRTSRDNVDEEGGGDDENGTDQKESQQPPSVPPHHRRKPQQRHALGYTGRTATRWVLTAVAGLLTGLASVFIVQLSGIVVGWRSRNLQSLITNPQYSDTVVLSVFLMLNLLEALAACWLCVGWVPTATGSGIPAVKAYLNGIRTSQKFTRWNVLFVKIVGTILSVSSGFAVGQEGPLIHIGAIMGSGCSKISGATSRYLQKFQNCSTRGGCFCRPGSCRGGQTLVQRLLTWTTTELSSFATDGERRDFVSIGASCGFAASFGAPVGGLLFILDDISSYFSKNLILRILVANALGTFCLAARHHDLSNYSVINLGTYTETEGSNIFINRVEEIPLYILVGIAGGILGGLFCRSFMFLRRNITGKYPARGQGRAKWQLLEVAIVSILTSVLIYTLPSHKWACKPNPNNSDDFGIDYEAVASGMPGYDPSHPHRERFFCGEGQINELANMLFGSRIDAIKRILTDPAQFKLETLLAVGSLFYVLMTVTIGIAIPSGIFTPTVLIGASFGGAAGIMFQEFVDPAVTPSTFALLGVAALLAGIQRSTVSVAVILVEGTGQIKVLTPAIITVVVARYVASIFYEKGVFEAILELKNLPYLAHEENKRRYDGIEVGDILTDIPVESVGPMETAQRLVELLETSAHHGFPVIDSETKRFLGLVRRDQIAALLECGVFDRTLRNNVVSSAWARPQAGVEKTPLMRWAYHINDDRYAYINNSTSAFKVAPQEPVERAPRFSMMTSTKLQLASFSALPTEFATVRINEDGNLYISWLDPDFNDHWVNIGAVMNRGAYVVTEFCPVSKAYQLFTSLGLRHLVVLGGSDSGGEVVGVLSRANLVPEYIRERTGL